MAAFGEVLPVPPLRDRKEDIADIATALLGGSHQLASETLRALVRREWPGNASELRSVLAVAQNRATGPHIRSADLPDELLTVGRHRRLTPIQQLEADAILRALKAAGDDKRAAAQELGISRATLYRKLKTLGISP